MTQHGMSGRSAERKPSPLFELACVLVRLDHVARFIVNANPRIMWTAAMQRGLRDGRTWIILALMAIASLKLRWRRF
jgi:hypothetical protein